MKDWSTTVWRDGYLFLLEKNETIERLRAIKEYWFKWAGSFKWAYNTVATVSKIYSLTFVGFLVKL